MVNRLLAGFRARGLLPAPSPFALTDLIPVERTANRF